MAAEASVHRIPGEVAREFKQVPISLDPAGIEAPLEEVPVDAMLIVEALRVSTIQPLHAGREITLRCFENEVVVIGH